jgi:hypothetical protein
VFALVDEGGDGARDVRELRRIPLAPIRASDVVRVQLVIHVSTGPQLVWFAYRRAYFVEVGVSEPDAEPTGAPDEKRVPGPNVYFFRYVVDADNGDVLEDARAPVVTGSGS